MGNAEKLESLISAVDKIVDARASEEGQLFTNDALKSNIVETLGLAYQDPPRAYELYYDNIQKILKEFLPKDNAYTKVIRNLVGTLLSHKEMADVSSGKRGADSRMATTEDMSNLVEVLTDWSSTPYDYLRLATILLEKNKDLGYSPVERELKDFIS